MKKNTIKKEPVECPLSPGRSCLHCPSGDGCDFNGRISAEEREMTRCGMYSPPAPEWENPLLDEGGKKTTKHIPTNEGYTWRKMPQDAQRQTGGSTQGTVWQPLAAYFRTSQSQAVLQAASRLQLSRTLSWHHHGRGNVKRNFTGQSNDVVSTWLC